MTLLVDLIALPVMFIYMFTPSLRISLRELMRVRETIRSRERETRG